jgi:hypothetical protein
MEPLDSAVLDHAPTGNQSAAVPDHREIDRPAKQGARPHRSSKDVLPYGAMGSAGKTIRPRPPKGQTAAKASRSRSASQPPTETSPLTGKRPHLASSPQA